MIALVLKNNLTVKHTDCKQVKLSGWAARYNAILKADLCINKTD